MRDNEEAESTSGPQPAQTETGIILRTRPSGVLTERVGNQVVEVGAGPAQRGAGAAFFAFLPGTLGVGVGAWGRGGA